MRRALLLLALAGCGGSDALELGLRLDPSPFEPARDERITTHTGLDAVAVGLPVTLEWTVPGAVAFLWTLEPPAGSAATLSSATDAAPSFTPDVAGAYEVGVTVEGVGGAVEQATRRITAATYQGQARCNECHVTRAEGLAAAAHAKTIERNGAAVFGAPGCTTCHVLDPVPPPALPVPGGYEDEADRAGFAPGAYTTFGAFEATFPTVADRTGVQCESCHGPGSEHESDPRRIGVSLRTGVCASCHDGTVGPDRATQWENSAHGNAPPAAALADASCRRCHSARAFLADLAGVPAQPEPEGSPGVTCSVCHDPHDDGPAQVRVFGTVPFASGGAYNGGRAGSCLICHQSDVPDPAAHAAANDPFPCAVQADMLAARGAVEFSMSFGTSFHGTTVFRLRTFTGDPEDSDTPDACVVCHMAEAAGPLEDLLGGHAMTQRSGMSVLATGNCDRCHPGLATFDFRIGQDFDGDGLAQGVQTEVKGLLGILFVAIRAADAQGGVSRPGGALTPATVSNDLTRTTPLLRQAVYNYNFVLEDGSFGVHNTTYAVQLLQRTYEQLTGVSFKTAFPRAIIR